ncbi:toxin-antitoxin system, toxin component, Txe/YoeB family [Marinilactibacillus piezotolerans]|uniref:Endoribonuclease YoeB n=1 Tax=Marinilactibacillus piezotolerans TaxID=258723 RepID=A0A1I3XFW7_9LACT|nr:Txe/YoeB family addiction module toxin [Marinilactibacillus piezotolerans]SFK18380.1 toxin-antitoxin system, toxin component, Txe/YoeB family [Marinilactibacillus piezotolerans]
MGYSVSIKKQVQKDLKKLKAAHLERKVKELIVLLKTDLFLTPPPYEKLIGNLAGHYSRRINIKHRLVYTVDEINKQVTIISAWTHYEKNP